MCKTFMDQLSHHQTSNSTALLKSVSSPTSPQISLLPTLQPTTFPLPLPFQLVRILALLLEAQATSVWTDSYSQKVYQMILNFTIHPKPKVSGRRGRGRGGQRYLSLYSPPPAPQGCSGGCGLHAKRWNIHWGLPSSCCPHCQALQARHSARRCGTLWSAVGPSHPSTSVCLSVSACPLPPPPFLRC